MAISDKKKVAHLVDVIADQVVAMKKIADRLVALRQAYQDQNVDATGTPLEGHVAQASAWIDAVVATADNAVANAFIDNKSGRHRPPSALGKGL